MFLNCKEGKVLRSTLEEMGHPQPATNMTVDNSTAHGLTQGTMVAKKSKAMDMRFHWLRCREAQRHINFLWRRGKNNRADYHTKHHPPSHHVIKRPEYIAQQADYQHTDLQRSIKRVTDILYTRRRRSARVCCSRTNQTVLH